MCKVRNIISANSRQCTCLNKVDFWLINLPDFNRLFLLTANISEMSVRRGRQTGASPFFAFCIIAGKRPLATPHLPLTPGHVLDFNRLLLLASNLSEMSVRRGRQTGASPFFAFCILTFA